MDSRVYRVLEFDKVKHQVDGLAATSLGKERVLQLQPTIDLQKAIQWQQETQEGVRVLQRKGTPPFGGIFPLQMYWKRAQIGSILQPYELLQVASTLSATRQLKRFFNSLVEEGLGDYPILSPLVAQLTSVRELEEAILQAIGEQGDVLDEASSALRSIRQGIRSLESRIREKLNSMVRSASTQKMLQDPIVTIRNDRYCLPVKQEYRGVFGGIVHDQSASGATLFMEPAAVVQMNNQLREMQGKEEREVERILLELSALVADAAEALEQNSMILSQLDFIFAKAKYALAIRGTEPRLNQERYLRFKQARHPLLPADQVVPIDVELGGDFTQLLITGPNTGGKTVTLKTIGLLSLMAMSGLHLPVAEGGEAAVFSGVYADIGDEQSIEQSLSTFSSHMTNIISILNEMDQDSLVLLDELGAGTDPAEGAALAIAILDYLRLFSTRVVTTTHYPEIKAYAYNTPEAMNASVEFDVDTLRPTYRLLIGIPGRSNAFAIAERLGIPSHIIKHAKAQIGEETRQVENMIQSLEENQKEAELNRTATEALRAEAQSIREQLRLEKERFEQERNQLMEQAKKELEAEMRGRLKEAEQLIQDLRQMALEEETSIKEHRLIEAKRRLEEASQITVPSATGRGVNNRASKDEGPLHPGDPVLVLHLQQKGHIIEQVNATTYLVQIGIMKMKIERKQLERVKEPKQELVHVSRVKAGTTHVPLELDLRGELLEDAIIRVDKYLDEAMIAGLHQVHLIHGKGTGALRKGIQEYLRHHQLVKSYRLGGEGEGGSGVTVVEI